MKLHIISDLHLDFSRLPYEQYEFEKDSILVIAGDLAEDKNRIADFFDAACTNVREAIYVMGNHEYYYKELSAFVPISIKKQLLDRTYGLADNVRVCDAGTYEIDDVVFICATLWTDFYDGNEFSLRKAKQYMSDYQTIRNGPKLLQPIDIYHLHKLHLEYIQSKLKEHQDKKCVVVTHHGPSFKSMDERYDGRDGNEFFYSDLDYLFYDHDNIACWIHGHTHASMNYTINNTRIVCNPRGYSRYKDPMNCENYGFNPRLKVEI